MNETRVRKLSQSGAVKLKSFYLIRLVRVVTVASKAEPVSEEDVELIGGRRKRRENSTPKLGKSSPLFVPQ